MKKISFLVFILLTNLSLAQNNTILWKITSNETNSVSYLLGNFHQIGDSFIDKYPIIEEKIKNSDLVILETEELSAKNIINLRKENYEINDNFNAEELKNLKKLTSYHTSLLYKYTPIELSWKLQQEYTKRVCGSINSNDKFDDFDNYIYYLAKKNKIQTMGFATMEEQVENLNKQYQHVTWKSEKNNIIFYLYNLTKEKIIKTQVCDDVSNYVKLNIDYKFESSCDFLDVLLTERNNKWIEELLPLLKTKNTFISVGYFHLGYKCGLINQLKKSGYKVEPVKMK